MGAWDRGGPKGCTGFRPAASRLTSSELVGAAGSGWPLVCATWGCGGASSTPGLADAPSDCCSKASNPSWRSRARESSLLLLLLLPLPPLLLLLLLLLVVLMLPSLLVASGSML